MTLGRLPQLLQAYICLDVLRTACKLTLTLAGAATGHAKSSSRALAAAVISDTPVRIAVSAFVLIIEGCSVRSSDQSANKS